MLVEISSEAILENTKSTNGSSSVGFTKNTNFEEQVLSAQALQVLSELPDLSFMRSKRLMFPLSQTK